MVAPMMEPIPSSRGGAVEEIIWQLSKHLAELGNEVFILNDYRWLHSSTWGRRGAFGDAAEMCIKSLRSLAECRATILRKSEHDASREGTIIHSHNFFFTLPAAATELGKKHILSLHHPISSSSHHSLHSLYERSLGVLNRLGIMITVPSHQMEEEARERYSISTVCVPNGVDAITFNPSKREESIRKSLADGYDHVVLSVGRFIPIKNQLLTIRAIEQLHKTNRSKVRAVLVGPSGDRFEESQDSEYFTSLVEYVRSHGLRDAVRILPAMNKLELAPVYASSDILVQSSLVEGAPLVLLEALSSGLPTIASDIPPHREVITNGYDGFLVNRNDHVELAEIMIRLLDDKNRRMEIGSKARETILTKYDWRIVTPRWSKLYHRCLEKSSASTIEGMRNWPGFLPD